MNGCPADVGAGAAGPRPTSAMGSAPVPWPRRTRGEMAETTNRPGSGLRQTRDSPEPRSSLISEKSQCGADLNGDIERLFGSAGLQPHGADQPVNGLWLVPQFPEPFSEPCTLGL